MLVNSVNASILYIELILQYFTENILPGCLISSIFRLCPLVFFFSGTTFPSSAWSRSCSFHQAGLPGLITLPLCVHHGDSKSPAQKGPWSADRRRQRLQAHARGLCDLTTAVSRHEPLCVRNLSKLLREAHSLSPTPCNGAGAITIRALRRKRCRVAHAPRENTSKLMHGCEALREPG